eukprot:4589195-Alexandrium_andersonii.AAC.1
MCPEARRRRRRPCPGASRRRCTGEARRPEGDVIKALQSKEQRKASLGFRRRCADDGAPPRIRTPGVRQPRPHRATEAPGCLLYTSDAADDM